MLKKHLEVYKNTKEKLKALNHAFVVINWDSETEAPIKSLDARSEIIGTLSNMYNDLLFDQSYVDAVNELFNNLNINKIIKFDRKEHLIENFGITIDSVQTKNLSYTLHDVVIKLIEMRNVLAHEVDNIIFKEKHIVDNLSIECIKKYPYEWLEGLDVTRIDNESLAIYSNLIYMELVIKKLSS